MIWVFLFSNEFFLRLPKLESSLTKRLHFVVLDYLRWQSPIRVYKIRDDLTEYSRKLWVTHLALKVPNYYR
jgi:hypothetical protein